MLETYTPLHGVTETVREDLRHFAEDLAVQVGLVGDSVSERVRDALDIRLEAYRRAEDDVPEDVEVLIMETLNFVPSTVVA